MKTEASLCCIDQLSADGISGERSSGFMELLNGSLFHEYSSSYSSLSFDFPPPPTPVTFGRFSSASSEVVNLPATPNESSISSSSTEVPTELDPGKEVLTTPDADEDDDSVKDKTSKEAKKKGQKRKGEPRFAFLTKSETDHLEDGYRWRKYGQKAVKDSPFPRGYYRCTTAMCGVKKRVERSSRDPTIVVTTYEGRHTHQSPTVPRGRHPMDRFAAPLVQLPSDQLHLPFSGTYLPQLMPRPLDFHHVASRERTFLQATTGDHGSLHDLISSAVSKIDD